MADEALLSQARAALAAIQTFDPLSITRKEELGRLSFESAVEPTRRLVWLFKQIPLSALDVLPDGHLTRIRSESVRASQHLEQILSFSWENGGDSRGHANLISGVSETYNQCFNELFNLIGLLGYVSNDFTEWRERGKKALDSIGEDASEAILQARAASQEAQDILSHIRQVAAENGVTQMSTYFATEASEHQASAKNWLAASCVVSSILIAYAIVTFFIFNWFGSMSPAESAQIVTSKLLVFGVLLFGLLQCVKSYNAHRHNSVTNKHRQNALLTFRSLVDAGNSPELRDAVLQHAAAAIYAPNDSGYLRTEERGYGPQALISLLPKSGGSSQT